MEDDALDEMKELIVLSRKREINFGLCMGKTPAETGLLFHRIKPPEVLMRKARRLDGVVPSKATLGTARAKGRKLMLTCVQEPPPGAARRLRRFLLGADLPMKVILLDASGTIVDEDGDDETEAEAETGALTGDAGPVADALDALDRAKDGWIPEDGINKAMGKWRKARRLVGPKIVAYAKGPTPDATGIGQSWARALTLGDKQGDPAGAYRMLTRIVSRIKAAGSASGSAAPETAASKDAQMAEFKALARKMRRRIEADGSARLRKALIDAVRLAHGGDPAAALDLLEHAAKQAPGP